MPFGGGGTKSGAMNHAEIIAMLADEARAVPGPVPRSLDGIDLAPGRYQLEGEEYLLHTASGLRIHYRKGAGVTVERSARSTPEEEFLCLNGGVYAAIACIHGLYPIHASAVACNGRAYAFSGPSGSGKSTLAAGLAAHGMPLFCDDTMILDLADPQRIVALPGHKRLKLSAESLTLTGASAEEPVAPDIAKFYAQPVSGAAAEALPLAELIFLETGPDLRIEPLSATQRLMRLQDDHYTTDLARRARGGDAAAGFATLTRLARDIPMFRFERPFAQGSFAGGAAFIAGHIAAQASPPHETGDTG